MKKVILASTFVFLAACSSQKKAADASSTAPAAPSSSQQDSKKAEKAPKVSPKKEASSPAAVGTVTCTNGSDTRKIEVKVTEAKGCELHYTKFGATETIATQVEGNEKCIEVQERIKGRLEAAGFSCIQ